MTRISLFFLVLFLVFKMNAQTADAGLWVDASLSRELTDNLSLTLSPEIRLDENMSRWARGFFDLGAEYRVSKRVSMSATYRGGWANDGVHIDSRQRVQYGVSAKDKRGDFVLQYQTRFQASLSGVASDADADFVSVWRNRAGVKYTGLKRLDVSTSFEVFNSVSSYTPLALENWRWMSQVTRKISKKQSATVGYLIQRDLTESPQEIDYVILLSYKVDL